MKGNNIFIKLTACINTIVQTEGWRTSNTTLMPKTPKPTASYLRLIALLNTSYEIFMGLLKSEVSNE